MLRKQTWVMIILISALATATVTFGQEESAFSPIHSLVADPVLNLILGNPALCRVNEEKLDLNRDGQLTSLDLDSFWENLEQDRIEQGENGY